MLEQFSQYLLVQEHKSPRTVEAYAGAVNRLLLPHGDRWKDYPFIRRKIVAWRLGLDKAKSAKEISAAKIRLDVAALRKFYEWAVGQNMISQSPMEGVKSQAREDGLPRPMPVEDVARLMKAVEEDFPDLSAFGYRAMFGLLLNGLRQVEVIRLTRSAIEYDATEQTFVLRVIGKGNKLRDVVLQPEIASYLVLYLLQTTVTNWQVRLSSYRGTAEEKAFMLIRDTLATMSNDLKALPVFTRNGSSWTRQQVNRLFRHYRSKAKVSTTWGPHSLRHTCATEMLNNGVDIRSVQEVLGHQSITQTQTYTKVLRGSKSKAARQLPNFGGVQWPSSG